MTPCGLADFDDKQLKEFSALCRNTNRSAPFHPQLSFHIPPPPVENSSGRPGPAERTAAPAHKYKPCLLSSCPSTYSTGTAVQNVPCLIGSAEGMSNLCLCKPGGKVEKFFFLVLQIWVHTSHWLS